MAVLVVLVFCFLVLDMRVDGELFLLFWWGRCRVLGLWAWLAALAWLFWLCGVVWLVGCYLYSGASICDASFFCLVLVCSSGETVFGLLFFWAFGGCLGTRGR